MVRPCGARGLVDPADMLLHQYIRLLRDAAARHDHVEMRVVGERRSPAVEGREDADAGAEVFF